MTPLVNFVLTDVAARRSGAAHAVGVAVDAATTWFPVQIGDAWRLGRDHDCGDDREHGFFSGGNPRPLQLSQGDAKALADALNRRRLPARSKL